MTDRLPPLPPLRALTAELRELHAAWSHPVAGGEYVALRLSRWMFHGFSPQAAWGACAFGADAGPMIDSFEDFGREWIPGSIERECTCRGGWRIKPGEDGGPESCRACGGTGRVHVPTPFDATAAARRLLAAARDGCAR